MAEYIKEAADADLFEVETIKNYALDYSTCIQQAKEELRQQARPALKKMCHDLSPYKNIIIAGPCWWGTYPMAIFTQLEALDFKNKNVYPLITHEGSGLALAPSALKKYCHGAIIKEGLSIHGAEVVSAKAQIISWAQTNLGGKE